MTLPPPAEDIERVRQWAERDRLEENKLTPKWYADSIVVVLDYYDPDPNDKRRIYNQSTMTITQYQRVSYHFLPVIFLSSVSIFFVVYLLISIGFFTAGEGWKFFFYANTIAWMFVPALIIISSITGGGARFPWHFSAFVGYSVITVAVVVFRFWEPIADAAAARRKRVELQRQHLRLVQKEKQREKTDKKYEIEDNVSAVFERIIVVQTAVSLLVRAQESEKRNLGIEVMRAITALTGYEDMISKNKNAKENIRIIIESLDELGYDKRSIEYKKLNSLLRM